LRVQSVSFLTVKLLQLKVAEPDLSQFNLSLVDPDQVQVLTSTNYTYGVNISVGQTAWIPFVIQIPPLTISPVQVSVPRILHLGSIL